MIIRRNMKTNHTYPEGNMSSGDELERFTQRHRKLSMQRNEVPEASTNTSRNNIIRKPKVVRKMRPRMKYSFIEAGGKPNLHFNAV